MINSLHRLLRTPLPVWSVVPAGLLVLLVATVIVEVPAAPAPEATGGYTATLTTPAAPGYVLSGQGTLLTASATLDDTAGASSGLAFQPAADPASALAGLAAALAVPGKAHQSSPTTWTWDSGDRTRTPALWLSTTGIGAWSYSPAGPVAAAGAAAMDSTQFSTRLALARARALAAALHAPDTLTWTVTETAATGARTLTGRPSGPVLADLITPLGLEWTITFAADGTITSAGGYTATVVAHRNIATVGARTAVARVAQRIWQPFGPFPVCTGACPTPATASRRGLPRTPVVVAVDEVAVASARPVLLPWTNPDGTVWALPGYLLTATDARQFTVLAVAESDVTLIRTGR